MNVSIIGTGYVGLVTGACLADKGCRVTCVDRDAGKVESITRGVSPFFEPGLDELLKKVIGKTLSATTDLLGAVLASDITLIATGTPFDGKEIDLTAVKGAAAQIGAALKRKNSYHTVVVKSTVVPGTTSKVILPILEESSGKKAGRDFGVGMNPEFLSEGEALHDFMFPDRIVLGGIDQRTLSALDGLYGAFPDAPRLRTNTTTAEMIKYTSNALLATAISFTNEIGNLCAALGEADIADVMEGVHLARVLSPEAGGKPVRAGITNFLMAGCGFGGSCLPKDVKALIVHGQKAGVPMSVLDAVIKTNADQPRRMIEMLERHLGDLRSQRIAVMGLAFKPDTDDLRETPAFPIIDMLLERGAKVRAFDPAAGEAARKALAGRPVEICASMEEALRQAAGVALVTRWAQFQRLPDLLSAMNPRPVLVDGRRMLNKNAYSPYAGIGLSGGSAPGDGS